jgi:type 1 glutamine amidotransferase
MPNIKQALDPRPSTLDPSFAVWCFSGIWRLVFGVFLGCALPIQGRTIVLVAGTPSHPTGMHEYRAGCLLLKQCLDQSGLVESRLFTNGWPQSENAFDGADAIFLYMDGGPRHAALREQNLKQLRDLMKKGVGLGCAHFAVEVPKDHGGEWLEWLGGYYEVGYSINPTWAAVIASLPSVPVTRGVKPFSVRDEWYFNIRFNEKQGKLTPILIARPSLETRQNSYGPYPHIVQAAGREETLMWTYERPGGGRSFGFTGAHFHDNWGNESFRKLVLNALLWTAHVEVPKDGLAGKLPPDQLKENLDPKPAK